jgi:hypothetical protein
VIESPVDNSSARSIVLRSSRMLPGQAYPISSFSAAGVSFGTGRSARFAAFSTNARASGSISSLRARRGGISSEMPFSR